MIRGNHSLEFFQKLIEIQIGGSQNEENESFNHGQIRQA